MKPAPFTYHRPDNLEEALDILSRWLSKTAASSPEGKAWYP